MVAKYGCKREKSQEAKQRSAEERKPVWEMERAVDVDLFLEAQEQWAKDSPHRLIILHKNVPTCCIRRAEGGRTNCLLGLLAVYASIGP